MFGRLGLGVTSDPLLSQLMHANPQRLIETCKWGALIALAVDWRCAAGGGAGDLDPRPAAVAADRALAAGCGEHSVDPAVQLPHLSGSGPASCRQNRG